MTERETVAITDDGLFIPAAFRDFGQQLVIRTPRSTIQVFGSDLLDAYYGTIDESDFGDPECMRDPMNPDLAPDRVRLKIAGEDAEEFRVAIDGEEAIADD